MLDLFLRKGNFMMNIKCLQRNFITASMPLVVPVQPPSKMETHLWYIVPDEVKSMSLLNQYSELLLPCEKENVNRMRGDDLRKRALLARTLVRTTIARYHINSEVNPRSLKFRKNAYGKPTLELQTDENLSISPLQFNVSHTSSMIACGVTMNTPIGIDVEEKQRTLKNDILAFSQRYFSPYEVKRLAASSDPEVRRQEFIKLWTLKEAYVKAVGRGFSAMPFKTFSIRSRPGTSTSHSLPEDFGSEASQLIVDSLDDPDNLVNKWQFALLELASSHFAAICSEKDKTIEGLTDTPMRLTVWKTIPFVEDLCMSGTDAVRPIGLIKQ